MRFLCLSPWVLAISVAWSSILLSSLVQAEPASLAVAVRNFENAGVDPYFGASLSDLLVNDLAAGDGAPCKLRVVEWKRRAEVLREIELGQSRYADKSTFPQLGHLIEPNVFIDGAVNTTDSTAIWSVQAKDAVTGDVLAEDKGSVPSDQILDASKGIAKRLAEKLCKLPSFVAKGGGPGLTITGTVNDISRPFVLHGTGQGFTLELLYTPTKQTGSTGTMTYKGKGGGVSLWGVGNYTIDGIESGRGPLTLTAKPSGCVDGPGIHNCRQTVEVVTLTPIN